MYNPSEQQQHQHHYEHHYEHQHHLILLVLNIPRTGHAGISFSLRAPVSSSRNGLGGALWNVIDDTNAKWHTSGSSELNACITSVSLPFALALWSLSFSPSLCLSDHSTRLQHAPLSLSSWSLWSLPTSAIHPSPQCFSGVSPLS